MSYFSQFGGAAPTKVTAYNSGSGNYTPISTNQSWARITLIGGGAGGTGAANNSNDVPNFPGTGGGGGGSTLAFVKLTESNYAYSVGAAGNAGSFQGAGGSGGNTTFGNFYAGGGKSGTMTENYQGPNQGIGGSGTYPGGFAGGMFSNSSTSENRLPLSNNRIGGGSLYGYGQTNGAGVGGDGGNSGGSNPGNAGKAGLIYIEEFVQG